MPRMKNFSKWKAEMEMRMEIAVTRDGSSRLVKTMDRLLNKKQTSNSQAQIQLYPKALSNKRVKNCKLSTLVILLVFQALQPNKNLVEIQSNPQLQPLSHNQDLKPYWVVNTDTQKKSGSWNGKAPWIFQTSKHASATPTTRLCTSEIRWLSKTHL